MSWDPGGRRSERRPHRGDRWTEAELSLLLNAIPKPPEVFISADVRQAVDSLYLHAGRGTVAGTAQSLMKRLHAEGRIRTVWARRDHRQGSVGGIYIQQPTA